MADERKQETQLVSLDEKIRLKKGELAGVNAEIKVRDARKKSLYADIVNRNSRIKNQE